MNKTVEIVTEWASFEALHPDATIDDYCRHRLTSRKSKKEGILFEGQTMPTNRTTILVKLISRISKLNQIYADTALADIELKQLDDFVLLNAISVMSGARKTEVIYGSFYELSTGLLILDRLKSQGYIREIADEEDKRSKRLLMTKAGEKILIQCNQMLSKVSEMIFLEMPMDDVALCIQLLKDIDIKFSNLLPKHKGKTFNKVFQEVTETKLMLK